MILYQDGFLTLDYDANTDILYVPCPDIKEYDLLLIQRALATVVETLISYDIKKFLFDCSQSRIEISEEDYQRMMGILVRGLMTSRLQKLARVVSAESERENRLELFMSSAKVQGLLPYDTQNFTNKTTALNWLTRT